MGKENKSLLDQILAKREADNAIKQAKADAVANDERKKALDIEVNYKTYIKPLEDSAIAESQRGELAGLFEDFNKRVGNFSKKITFRWEKENEEEEYGGVDKFISPDMPSITYRPITIRAGWEKPKKEDVLKMYFEGKPLSPLIKTTFLHEFWVDEGPMNRDFRKLYFGYVKNGNQYEWFLANRRSGSYNDQTQDGLDQLAEALVDAIQNRELLTDTPTELTESTSTN